MIAMTIAGFILVSARMMIDELADSTDWITKRAEGSDYSANAERLLRELVGRTQSATITQHSVAGNAVTARIATACDAPGGWLEDCEVWLTVIKTDSLNALGLILPGDTIVFNPGLRTARLLYLVDAELGGTWLPYWNSAITTPAAIGIALDGDTLILRIGERG
jgi:hypothetical protein